MRIIMYGCLIVSLLWPALPGSTAAGPAANPTAILPHWEISPGTRVVEQGAVLENALVYVKGNGQRGPGAWPQAAVVQCGPISGAQPGRYRAGLRARTVNAGGSSLVLQAWVRQADGGAGSGSGNEWRPIPVASTSMSGYRFAQPGQWQQFTLDFDVDPGKPTMVGVMYLGDATAPPTGAVQIEQTSLTLEKLATPVSIRWSRPVKLRYHRREPAALDYRLQNFTDQSQLVAVRPVVVDDREQRTPTPATPVTVPPRAAVSGRAPFTLPGADGGFQIDVELLSGGKVVDRRAGDVCCVSDSPFLFMMTNPATGRSPGAESALRLR